MIETARLLLRKPRLDDWDSVSAMWADPVVTRHITGSPLPRRQAWMNLLSQVGHWDLLGYGGWIVVEKSTGRFVGQVGFQLFIRGIDPALEPLPEAGWVLATEAHGQGYATEAVAAALAWADRSIEVPATVAIVNVGNAASRRVAGKVGFREVRYETYLESAIVLFRRPRGG
jgi:RimJ/RimL family protein N-acetyltransferase